MGALLVATPLEKLFSLSQSQILREGLHDGIAVCSILELPIRQVPQNTPPSFKVYSISLEREVMQKHAMYGWAFNGPLF